MFSWLFGRAAGGRSCAAQPPSSPTNAEAPKSSHEGAGSLPGSGASSKAAQSLPALRRHNVLFAGLRRSGKTSILKRVYENFKSDETLYLSSGSTGRSEWTVKTVDGFVPLRLWDGPEPFTTPSPRPGEGGGDEPSGSTREIGFDDTASAPPPGVAAVWNGQPLLWQDVGAVVYVIDSQDGYSQSFGRCMDVILTSFSYNPFIKYHIFVHKLDQGPGRETSFGMEDKREAVHSMEDNIKQDLADAAVEFAFAPGAGERWRAHQAAEKARVQEQAQARSQAQAQAQAQAYSQTHPETSPMSSNPAGLGLTNDYIGGQPFSLTEGLSGREATLGMRLPPAGPDAKFGGNSGYHSSWSGSDSDIVYPLEQIVDIQFHGTSIYDSSVILALSKVQQSLMEPYLLRGLETALGSISASCRFDGAFLIDVPSKLYLASNLPSPTELPYEMITEYLYFLTGLASIYADLQDPSVQEQVHDDPDDPQPRHLHHKTHKRRQSHQQLQSRSSRLGLSAQSGNTSARSARSAHSQRFHTVNNSPGSGRLPSSPLMPSLGSGTVRPGGAPSTYLNVQHAHGTRPRLTSANASSIPSSLFETGESRAKKPQHDGPGEGSAGTNVAPTSHATLESSSSSTGGREAGSGKNQGGCGDACSSPLLNTGQVSRGKYAYSCMWMGGDMGLALYQIDNQFALVAIVHKEAHDRAAGLVEYNISWFRRTITELITVVQVQQLSVNQ